MNNTKSKGLIRVGWISALFTVAAMVWVGHAEATDKGGQFKRIVEARRLLSVDRSGPQDIGPISRWLAGAVSRLPECVSAEHGVCC